MISERWKYEGYTLGYCFRRIHVNTINLYWNVVRNFYALHSKRRIPDILDLMSMVLPASEKSRASYPANLLLDFSLF